MKDFFGKINLVFQDSILRKRILFTLGALLVFRVLSAVPISGVDTGRLAQFFESSQFLGLLNVFSGGGLSQLSIVMLGVGPYITGSIIMQLLTIMSPKLKAMYQEDGEAGRRKFAQYGRIITIPLAILQSFSFLKILENQQIINNLTGIMLNSIFLDAIDADVERLRRINELILQGAHPELKEIPVLLIRPSKDLGKMSHDVTGHLPPVLRYLLKGIGVSDKEGLDVLSYLAFDESYTKPLMELGYEDAYRMKDAILRFSDDV